MFRFFFLIIANLLVDLIEQIKLPILWKVLN